MIQASQLTNANLRANQVTVKIQLIDNGFLITRCDTGSKVAKRTILGKDSVSEFLNEFFDSKGYSE